MHNWYVEEVVNREMRYEREQAVQARAIQKQVDTRAPWNRAWLLRWLLRLSSGRRHAGELSNQTG